ncbi:uncharacterized protein YecE (DUF72 family) [Wenyingzhuangia heitensis]|uniref:Uncharacterized protein YecE (DUF72 family) n=1 Tax=Wenyingzhuangia heitensis TaxID=1487859 RepID=A0ABX0UFM1_9FLAO|nr:DUF72 domain-containing protein [Wenyingzhuangia heitensis]NIJ45976.1 uncharacterized protein YecE (DUF72 family) [Wenyingzhuangia heitensis]
MQFGKVQNPEIIDFTLPKDHPNTQNVFDKSHIGKTQFSIGCAKWNKQDLKGFYPKGTKDELQYYSSQFNSIELNATFYKLYPAAQFQKWYAKTPSNFLFYPKLTQDISHYNRLSVNAYPITENYLNQITALKEKLGSVFLQMHEDFSPQEFYLLKDYISTWPKKIPLAVELRHTNWFNNPENATKLYKLFCQNSISNIITDTAARRDLLHMSLTSPKVFIRFVGSNHSSDYKRLNDWVDRIEFWSKKGVKSVSFFIHQNIEIESVLLASYFIKKLNKRLALSLRVPKTVNDIKNQQTSLF